MFYLLIMLIMIKKYVKMLSKNFKKVSTKSIFNAVVLNEKASSSQFYIEDINVVSQNWETSTTATAELLDLKDTEALCEFIINSHFLNIYTVFAKFQCNYFDLISDMNAVKNKTALVMNWKVFKFVHNLIYCNLIQQADTIKFLLNVSDALIASLNWLNAMIWIVIAHSTMFKPDETEFYFSFDLYCILQIIWWKWKSEINSCKKKDKFQNNVVVVPTYYTDKNNSCDEEVSDLIIIKNSDISTAQFVSINQSLNNDEISLINNTVLTISLIVSEPDFFKIFDNFIETISAHHDHKTESCSKLNSIMLWQTLKLFLKQIHIIFDSWTASEACAQILVLNVLTLKIVREDNCNDTQSNKFWELQDKLNWICIFLLTYESACDMLELDWYNLMLLRKREIVLKSW